MNFCTLLEHFFYEKTMELEFILAQFLWHKWIAILNKLKSLMKTNLEEFYFTEMKTEASTSFTNKEIMFICDDIKYS